MFSFSFPEIFPEFNADQVDLGYGKLGLVPYAWRASEPSIDRINGHRSPLDIQKRRRCKQFRTVEYEKAARVGVALNELNPEHQATCE